MKTVLGNGRTLADSLYGTGLESGERDEDKMQSLRDRLAAAEVPEPSEVPSWRPEYEGDMVCGKITVIRTADTQYGECTIYQIKDEAVGEIEVWAMRAALKTKMEKLAPKIGEEIGIRYDGMKDALNGGNSYHGYTVMMDRVDPNQTTLDIPKAAAKPAAKPAAKAADTKPINPEDPFADE